MLELIVLVGVCVAIGKIASADNKSGFLWGMVALGICILSMAIPLPFVRLLIAGVVTFVLMTVVNMVRSS
jgi:hypothetical protein